MKFFTTKTEKIPSAAKKSFSPRKEFLAQGKERFLAAFDASEFARERGAATHGFAIFLKFGVGVLALICLAAGVSVYADTANVPVTNPLYPLKRLSENVELAVVPASQKDQLQATFAVRRANEIAALQVSSPSSTLIPALTSDLDRDISSSLAVVVGPTTTTTNNGDGGGNIHGRYRGGYGAASATGTEIGAVATTSLSIQTSSASSSPSLNAGSIGIYCSAFDVSTSGVLIGQLESNLALHPGGFAQFNEQCASRDNDNNDHVRASAPPSPSALQTNSTSTDQYGHDHNRGFSGGHSKPGNVTSTVDIRGSLGL